MTLYRQLVIFTLLLFLFLFAGTWYAKLENTRIFLTDQLESHVQDTATSLALSISPHLAQKDMAAVEGMINAVFDRGYYERISLTDPHRKLLIERESPVKIEHVPAWFVGWIDLKTPEASADVLVGWNQGGTIHVKSHPGYAYAALWKDAVKMTAWFAGCVAFVFVAAGFGLRVLLTPLSAVQRQAEALCRKEYEMQAPLPRTREFRRVVDAMNRMTSKVKQMFEEQAAQAEDLQERAYQDALTGLGNRRYFESQIGADLARDDSEAKGILLLSRIHGLDALNKQRGFQAGDELLKRVAALFRKACLPYTDAALSRLTGGDFGIYIPNLSPSEGERVVAEITSKMSRLAVEQLALTDNIGHVGLATYSGTTTLARLLSEADLALSSAQLKGGNQWDVRSISETGAEMPLGQQQWKDILMKALEERRITLDAQAVVENSSGQKVVQLEIFARILLESGKSVNAALFMPIAERLKLVSSIDRIVIEAVLRIDFNQLDFEKIAINLSAASLEDDQFSSWVCRSLKALRADAPRICFEFSEFAAVQHLDLVREFSSAVRECGHGIGLDHYGRSFSKLGYLQSLHPEYVKIDRAYTGELMGEENDSRFYMASLCSVAHSIDIAVVAEGVETEQQARILRELNLDAMQGYCFGRPQPVAAMTKGGI
jgi:diguanylate cyclase (GGDEF)-like protein